MEEERTGFKTDRSLDEVIPKDGKWHHLVVRYQDGVFEYFIHGKKLPVKKLFRDPQNPFAYKEYTIDE